MAIQEGHVQEHELVSALGPHSYPGHEHDNDGLDLGDVAEQQTWRIGDAESQARPWENHVPVMVAGQDLSGGHQGVDITITLFQPAAGEQLNGSAVAGALGRDYDRLECRILAVDGPVLVCTSKEQAEQAYAVGQGGSTVIGGQFSWLPSGLDRVRRNCDELWLALPGPSAATTHVSIVVSRRLGVESANLA
jgi:hypothetical protein